MDETRINKKLLKDAFEKYKNFLNVQSESASDDACKKWSKAAKKLYPQYKKNMREFFLIKDLIRALKHKSFETVVKVFEALGYVVE